jgi:peptidoglycan hydrolase CwlO-like protein
MNKGRLRIEGAPEEVVEEKKTDLGPKEDVFDGAGNKIDVKATQSLSQKDMKKRIKDIEKKLKSAKKDNTLSEAEMYELTDKLAELKENVKKEEKA